MDIFSGEKGKSVPILVRHPNIVQVRNPTMQIESLLYSALAKRPRNYKYSKAYQEKRWDGYIRLYNINKHWFPSGLFPAVLRLLQEKQIDFQVIDKRVKPAPVCSFQSNISLRGYQERVLNIIKEYTQGVIWLPVNAGKTYVAMQLVADYQVPTLWIVKTKDLFFQTYKRAQELLGLSKEDIGTIGMGTYNLKPFTIAMVQTLTRMQKARQLGEVNKYFGMVIFDEAHSVGRNTYYKLMLNLYMYYRYALTGTPRHRDAVDVLMLTGAFGDVIVKMDNKTMYELGVSVRPLIQMIQMYIPTVKLDSYTDVYRECVVQNHERNMRIRDIAYYYKAQRKNILILVDWIEHGNELVQKYLPDAVFISGEENSNLRKQILEDYESGKVPILIATGILNEGISLHAIDVLINAAGGKSAVKAVQRVGRALRQRIGKDRAIVIDFYDTGNKWFKDHSIHRKKIYEKEFGAENVEVITSFNVKEKSLFCNESMIASN